MSKSQTLSPEKLRELKSYIGTEWMPNFKEIPLEPLSARDIWRYTDALDDRNPLWRDDEYARRFGWSEAPAPPGIMEIFAPNYRAYHVWKDHFEYLQKMMPFESPFGEHWSQKPVVFLLSESWDILQPLKVGQRIQGASFVDDVEWSEAEEHPNRLVITFKKKYVDMDSAELLGVTTWRLGLFSSAPKRSEANLGSRGSTDQSIGEIATAPRSGLLPEIGDNLPVIKHKMDMETSVRWSASLWDMGTPHFDYDYSRKVLDLPAPLINGPLICAIAARTITDWMDPTDVLRRHTARFRRHVLIGDEITVKCQIAGVSRGQDGRGDEVVTTGTVSNQRGELIADLSSVCELNASVPSRADAH